MTPEEAMQALETWKRRDAEHLAERDRAIRAAREAGVNIRQIALKSGISRTTIYKVLPPSEREREMNELVTEKVSENYQPRPGEMSTRQFWIAYPAHVSAYGHASDRIARAAGRGKTKKAALADAEKSGS